MRVGLFHASLPEPGRKPGGVEVFVHRLGQALRRAGHEVTVLSFSEPPVDAAYRHRPLVPRGFATNELARLTTVPVLLNRTDTSGLDVLHLHGDDWFYLRRRVPTVRTFHGYALYEARHATRLRRQLRFLATYPLEVVASHLATGSYAGSAGPAPALHRRQGMLPYGATAPATGVEKTEVPTVLFVGTWEGRKRGRFLKEVFERHVVPAEPSAQLWMVSDHCVESAHVRWFWSPSDGELGELYCRAWAFCLPSTYEGFGIPYVEAMAAGTPVVATPNPGSRMLLEPGRSGMIASDEDLEKALLRVLREPELRAALTEAGRRRAAEFGWERVVEAHESAYRKAVEDGGSSLYHAR